MPTEAMPTAVIPGQGNTHLDTAYVTALGYN